MQTSSVDINVSISKRQVRTAPKYAVARAGIERNHGSMNEDDCEDHYEVMKFTSTIVFCSLWQKSEGRGISGWWFYCNGVIFSLVFTLHLIGRRQRWIVKKYSQDASSLEKEKRKKQKNTDHVKCQRFLDAPHKYESWKSPSLISRKLLRILARVWAVFFPSTFGFSQSVYITTHNSLLFLKWTQACNILWQQGEAVQNLGNSHTPLALTRSPSKKYIFKRPHQRKQKKAGGGRVAAVPAAGGFRDR